MNCPPDYIVWSPETGDTTMVWGDRTFSVDEVVYSPAHGWGREDDLLCAGCEDKFDFCVDCPKREATS